MRPFATSLTATAMAAALFAVGSGGFSDDGLRGLGAAGGAALAIFAIAFGATRTRGRSNPIPQKTAEANHRELLPVHRFLLERRQAPRHDVQLPVQFAIDGQSYAATLVSVSARGALLRLSDEPGTKLQALIGQPVRIEDYPAGTLARIGNRGVYLDFAVQFEPIAAAPSEPVLVESASGRMRRI